jgi:hypothetical protein
VTLCVFDENGGRVETHRLVVENRCSERPEVVELEPCTRIGDKGEAGRVRFRKTIQGKGTDRLDDLFLRGDSNLILIHAFTQLDLQRSHLVCGTSAPESTTQLLCFAASEVRDGHCDAEQLLLKERDTQRPAKDRLKERVRVGGYVSWSVIPLRLTAAGHELAEGLENPKAFETVRKDFVGASLSTIKDVAVGIIKAEISKHTGLHF